MGTCCMMLTADPPLSRATPQADSGATPPAKSDRGLRPHVLASRAPSPERPPSHPGPTLGQASLYVMLRPPQLWDLVSRPSTRGKHPLHGRNS